MSSNAHTKNIPMVEEKDLENVELHRAESMINEQLDMVDKINSSSSNKPINKIDYVHVYVGTKARSIGSCLIQFSVEIIMFLYMFSYILRSITSTNMIMDKVCLVHLGYSRDVCRNLADYPKTKSEVEKMANNYHLGHSLIMLMPSAILALFIGTWSDRYGRKFPIICALVGIILDGFGITTCAYFFNSRVEFYFISALCTGLSGGFISVLMIMYSYASDVTRAGKRTMKYAVMEVAFGISMPLGQLAGGWIFKFSGYVPVFLTSTCGHILGLFWVIFFLEETRGLDNTDSWKQKFINFWTFDAVVSSFKATAKERPNKGRKQLWILILGMSITIFGFASLAGISFFFVHHQFNWENTTYSTVTAVYSVIGLSMMLGIVPLSKRWNIGDPVLGTVGSASMMVKNIVTGLAYKPWIFHIANILGLVSSLGSLASRARISKLVSKDDLGKVFSFLTTAESVLPILATTVVSQVFNLTLDAFPGLIYVIMGVLGIIPLVGFIWISRLPVGNYEEMEDDQTQEDMQVKSEEASAVKA